eukprot:Gregarina_sp_Poly_1__8263@NODE_481_length_8028_cov_336_122975_g389_i0_p8_GENE_NODE_481_length_8028_cov_336_122975_g389_i0NODE_481_length_8028_cov_336_122975_g389_i0_p8_ORF_typecomplete_len124_score26_44Ribosomal_L29/PF00831_23/2_2e11Ribosomal_L29/PF00831_23/2_2e03V_ATPase_I/PF01496_19/0_0074KORA/PF16509_5/0_83KORA/PF16509_5/2_6DUF3826/PF12875_7/0_017Ino80_Iec3/PF14612_6/0_036YqzH/PF14164_6/2_7YqzH/PF14164_6/93Sds3/PF08598_11/0_53_NODE_481_length_8028_cov_336_122975_g389_i049475318
MSKAKAYQLREQSVEDLVKRIQKEKETLASLRVGFDHKNHLNRVGKIQLARKNIARALTVYNQKRREAAKSEYAGKRWVPKEMRPKLTRALRQRLTPAQAKKVTAKESKRAKNFPKRQFVVLA